MTENLYDRKPRNKLQRDALVRNTRKHRENWAKELCQLSPEALVTAVAATASHSFFKHLDGNSTRSITADTTEELSSYEPIPVKK